MQDLITASENQSLILLQQNPYTLADWTPSEKGWIITKDLIYGWIHNPYNKNLKTRHYRLSSNNLLTACQGCKLKNKSYQSKHCYFNITKPLYNLQVDCKKKIHIDISDFKKALALTSLATSQLYNQNIQPILARPLCLFKNPLTTL